MHINNFFLCGQDYQPYYLHNRKEKLGF